MTALNTTNGTALLKILYPMGLEEIWYEESPFAAWVPKTQDFGGTNKQINWMVSGIRGSNTFNTAINAKSTPDLPRANVTRVRSYVIGSLDNEMLMASRGDRNAIAEAFKTQMDAAMYEFGRATAHQIWSNAGGARFRGDGAFAVGGTTVTLADANDIVFIEKGMVLQSSATDGLTGATRAGTVLVDSVDRDAGTFDTAANVDAGIAAVVNNDFFFRQGDFGNSLSGVLDWIPITAPTAGDNHFGVDRSDDVVRLAGSRFVATSSNIEETIFDGEARGVRNGGKFDTLWLHTLRFAELKKSIQSKAWYNMEYVKTMAAKSMTYGGKQRKTEVGIHGFVFPGENGPITVMSDANMPFAQALLTRRGCWELASLGGTPHFDTQGGDKLLVESSNDGKEFRMKAYWNLLCKRPIDNQLITLA